MIKENDIVISKRIYLSLKTFIKMFQKSFYVFLYDNLA